VSIDQLLYEWRVAQHHVVAPQHRERLVPNDLLGQQHRMPVAERRALTHDDEPGHLGRPSSFLQQLVFPARLEAILELEETIEVVLNSALGRRGNQHNFLDAGGDGTLDDVLNDRFVDDRQHLLGHCLGSR
jgi:hypothetical protein